MPLDASGLSEFGMGMKSAAAWFAPKWSVRTSALGEGVERVVRFDIDRIVRDTIEELEVATRVVPSGQHYTEIVLDEVRKMPQTKTVTKIRDHLSGIYRCFTRRGDLELRLDGELLSYDEPEILIAPHWKHKNEAPREWRKDIKLDLAGGRHAEGFVALRAKGSTARAGLALFRRNRLIEGNADETYRPPEIFGATNSFAYQRVFGEINLVGFQVSHTKDGIRWDEAEEEFIAKLRAALSTPALPILDQANNWRSTDAARESRPAAQKALAQLERDIAPDALGASLAKAQASAAQPAADHRALLATDRKGREPYGTDYRLRAERKDAILHSSFSPRQGQRVSPGDRAGRHKDQSARSERRAADRRPWHLSRAREILAHPGESESFFR